MSYETHYKTLNDEKLIYRPKHVLCGKIMKQIIIFIFIKKSHGLNRFYVRDNETINYLHFYLRKHIVYVIIRKTIFIINT
jgi:hypothetical protein